MIRCFTGQQYGTVVSGGQGGDRRRIVTLSVTAQFETIGSQLVVPQTTARIARSSQFWQARVSVVSIEQKEKHHGQ